MGWCRGAALAEEVWQLVRDEISFLKRREIARRLVAAFEARDCDTMDEATTLMQDAGVADAKADDARADDAAVVERAGQILAAEVLRRATGNLLPPRGSVLDPHHVPDPCMGCTRAPGECHVCEHGGP